MKILKKLIYSTLLVALFTVLPFVVFTLISANTNFFGVQSFMVLSGSMEPTIPVGSIIYTQRASRFEKGDVITYKSGDSTVTHRIIGVDANGSFITKGDANNTADSNNVPTSDIFGKQVISIPYVGHAISFLKKPEGFFPIVFFPIVVFIVIELWNLKREIENEAERKFQKRMAQENILA